MAENLQPDQDEEEEEEASSSFLTPPPSPTLYDAPNTFTSGFTSGGLQEAQGFDTDVRGVGEPTDLAEITRESGDRRSSSDSIVPLAEDEEDASYWADAGRGVIYGGLGFFDSLTWLAGSAGNTAIEIAEKTGLNAEGGFRFGELDLNESWKPKTGLGHFIGGLTEIAAGWALTAGTLGAAAPAGVAATTAGMAKLAAMGGKLNRFSRFYKWLLFSQKTSMTGVKLGKNKTFNIKWGSIRRDMTIGMIADFIAFKEHEERLSDMIQEWPIVGNVVTRYLASDKSDNWFEGRMKNAVEGLGLGAIASTLLPFFRTQRAIKREIALGNWDKAIDIQKQAAPEFQSVLKDLRQGEGTTVLHNVDTFRQYLTTLPDMNHLKLAAAEVMMTTAAKLHGFRDLNSWFRQGLRTGTLNQVFSAGALGPVDPSVFSNRRHMAHGSLGPLGDGTPYAMFETSEFRNIKVVLDDMTDVATGEPLKYQVHKRVFPDPTSDTPNKTKKSTIYIIPGMTITQAKQLTTKYKRLSFVSHKGIHQVDETGDWKIQPLKLSRDGKVEGVKVSDTGEYRFKDDEGEFRYDLEYEDELQNSIPSQHGDEVTLGHTADYLDNQEPFALPNRGEKGLSGRPMSDAGRARLIEKLETGTLDLAEAVKTLKGISLTNIEDVEALLERTDPGYLEPVWKFLQKQKEKVLSGEMTVRDTIKGAILTVASQQAKHVSWGKPKVGIMNKLEKTMRTGRGKKGIGKLDRVAMQVEYETYRVGQKINESTVRDTPASADFQTFLEWIGKASDAPDQTWDDIGGARALKEIFNQGSGRADMVRPEEMAGLWLSSPNGRLALDALENGQLLPTLWEELRHIRGAFGGDHLGNMNLLPQILTDATPSPARVTLPASTKDPKRFNFAQLQETTKDLNNHIKGLDEVIDPVTKSKTWIKSKIREPGNWDSPYVGRLFTRITGIGDQKEGFMKHFLGIGDTFTIDSNQMRFWLTGLPQGIKGAKGSVEEMRDLLYKRVQTFSPKHKTNFIRRVQAQNQELLDRMKARGVEQIPDEDLSAHIMHHWLWDRFMRLKTHPKASESAMTLAQRDSIGSVKGGITFGEDGAATMHLFNRMFSDSYGRTYAPSDMSTVIHEIAHIFRRAMKDPIAYRRQKEGVAVSGFQAGPSYVDDMKLIEKKLRVKDGNWTVAQEETFAKDFEGWIMGGGSVAGLEREFGQMKGWLEELYRNAHNSPMKQHISPEAKGVFARIFGKEGLPEFLTSKDHMELADAFESAIDEGMSLESSLEEVGMSLRLWSNETDTEDVMQGLIKFLQTDGGKKITARFKNPKHIPGKGGEEPRGFTYVHPKTGKKIKNANVQYNRTTLRMAMDLADEIGGDEAALIRRLTEDGEAASKMPEHLVAGKLMLDGYSRTIYQLIQKISIGEGGDRAMTDLLQLQQKFVDVFSSVTRIQRGTARSVQAGNIPIKGLDPAQMHDMILHNGGRDRIAKFAQDVLQNSRHDIGKVNLKQLRQMSKNRLFWDMSNEWRINGLLSSLKSLTIDLTSTTLHLAILPLERAWGGFLMGDREMIKEGLGLYYGYATAMKESLRLAGQGKGFLSGPVWQAFRQEKQLLDPTMRTSETAQHAWSKDRIRQVFPEAQGWKPSGMLAGFFHYAGFGIRWPSRFRMLSKEIFDQISYRARYRQILMKDALTKFDPLTQKDEIAKYIVENFEAGFDAMGRGLNKDALQYAREVNFSEPLEDGIGKVVTNMKFNIPATALIVPFVRTPTWLIRGFIGRSFGGAALLPGIGDMVGTLNPALRAIRADFLAGGTRKARALGKVSTGAMLYGSAVVLAYEGAVLPDGSRVRIIGSAPPDPAQAKIWEGSGKIANSVEITPPPLDYQHHSSPSDQIIDPDSLTPLPEVPGQVTLSPADAAERVKRYIGFDRLDPFWMFYGMAADYVQLSDYLTNDQREDIAAFGVLALSERLDGAYMKGALDFAGAWSEGGGKLEHFLANMSKSFAPRVAQQNPFSALAKIPGLEGLDEQPVIGNFFSHDKYRRQSEKILTAWQTIWPATWDKYGIKYDAITGKPLKERDAWDPFQGGGSRASFGGALRGEISPFLYSESRTEDNPMAKLSELLYGFGPVGHDKFGEDLRDIKTAYTDSDGIRVNNAYQALQKEIGTYPVEEQLNRLTQNPGWDTTPRETQIAQVKSTLRRLRDMAFGSLLQKNPELAERIMKAKFKREMELTQLSEN